MSFVRILCCFAIAGSAASIVAQTDPNVVVASVNGDEIKIGEYEHRLEWYRVDPSSPLKGLPVGFLALNELITERMIFQMAKEKGVTPTDPEIDGEEKSEIGKSPSLLQDLIGEGRSEDDLKQEIAYNLAQFNLKTYGVTITDQEVEQHYQQYPSDYTSSKQYRLRVVVVSDDSEQAAVDKDLSSGMAFADVATAHSLDVSKGNGGEFGTVPADEFNQPTREALDAVKIGQTTGWVRGSQQESLRVKYLVEDITPAKLAPLDADLRAKIRKQLSLDKGAVKNQVFKDLQAATLNAKVVISKPGFQKLYDQLIAQYRTVHPTG
jgi:hypothetical protein